MNSTDPNQIADEALYPGHVVRKLLASVKVEAETYWIGLTDAAAMIGCRADTLRGRCAKWFHMSDPPVRVRKKGPSDGSHWLLAESDLQRFVRPGMAYAAPAARAATEALGEYGAEIDEEATIAHWCDKATRNLDYGAVGDPYHLTPPEIARMIESHWVAIKDTL